jgi:hypothetical protein
MIDSDTSFPTPQDSWLAFDSLPPAHFSLPRPTENAVHFLLHPPQASHTLSLWYTASLVESAKTSETDLAANFKNG